MAEAPVTVAVEPEAQEQENLAPVRQKGRAVVKPE